MRITLTAYKRTTTIEWDHDDLNGDDLAEGLKSLLLASGWHPETVKGIFNEEAADVGD